MPSKFACDLGGESNLGGREDKAQHAQGRCRGVGWDMPQVDAKVGARVQPVSEARTKKVMVTN